MTSLVIEWCQTADPDLIDTLTHFFVSHINPSYISHSELQSGRAITTDQWHNNIPEFIRNDFIEALIVNNDPTPSIATARDDSGALIGLVIISFPDRRFEHTKFAVVDDVVVSPYARGLGVGKKLIAWIAGHLKAAGIQRLFLESGVNNHGAHTFFEQQGFKQVSLTMMREL
ncbi:GNAT family N-acetyltransferase [Aquirhabdus sp.]|uniref:GNAT family N-acetyltransferase n=1 Tax=Aquirhabdus sp. TaxID=2824160 RepID=UPI00396C95E6